VRVVHVRLDLTDTGLFAASGIAPSGRWALLAAEEVARACLFLASGDASFVSGAALHVDGCLQT
jgi:NAD(P)-dependent dehydrogenase (short-subunit alcohol dehydrogenase family)